MLHQALHMLEDGGIIEPVHNPLVQAELQVHVLPLDHGPVGQDLIGPALAAKGSKNRQVAEIIQVMVNGRGMPKEPMEVKNTEPWKGLTSRRNPGSRPK